LSIAKLLATTADVEAAAQLVRDVVSKIMKVSSDFFLIYSSFSFIAIFFFITG
jgi:predicted ATP-grasp superfamily ATP-dependent carboligase